MDVLVINSPLFRFSQGLDIDDSLPPLGLGYIVSNLIKHNISAELLDCVNEKLPLEDTIKYIEKKAPRFVAINIFTTNNYLVKEIVLRLNLDTRVIIGGLATKDLYAKIIHWDTSKHIDIVYGDGEIITSDIIRSNLMVTPDEEHNNRRLFKVGPGSPYYVSDISELLLDREIFKYEPLKNFYGLEEINISTSRGCIYDCAFCAAARSQYPNQPIRCRSSESLVNELKQIAHKYPNVCSIRIIDDLFLKSRTSIEEATAIFSGFKFRWRAMAHIRTTANADPIQIKNLVNSGCQELFIGIESGSPRILESINKTHDLDVITKSIYNVLSQGLNIKAYFICGFPGEELEDLAKTQALAQKLKNISQQFSSNIRYSVFQFRPYHGTLIYSRLQNTSNFDNLTIRPNEKLSQLIGRDQFNFHAGNYSNVCLDAINDYICRIHSLNGSYQNEGYKPTNN